MITIVRPSPKPTARIAMVVTFLTLPITRTVATPRDHIGEKLSDASLQSLDGKSKNLLSFHDAEILVIAYTGVGCPISQRYAQRLDALARKYQRKGVRIVGINANPQDNAAAIRKEFAERNASFPVLRDVDQALTRQLDAMTTTEAFVIDKNRVIRYRGMVDDQYAVGAQRKKPKNKYLELAIKSVLHGENPEVTRTAAPGCRITITQPTKPKSADVTYSSRIATIIQQNCQMCHRKGQIGPFPLTTYDDVVGWSAMIHSVLEDRRMPPWNADPDYDGVFSNQRSIPDEDKRALMQWIDDGMPRGNPDEDPPDRKWAKKWRIGKPDKIYKMRAAYRVPAEGPIDYQYFSVQTRFKQDKWIKAMEAIPGATEVVHHILVYVEDPKGPPIDRSQIALQGYLCATVPGDTPSIFPDGAAKRLPAGAKLWFQIHYTPNGQRLKDKSSVGFVFTDEPAKHEVLTESVFNFRFSIPPGHPNHEVRAERTLDEDINLIALFPHMHYRGKDWTYFAHLPDGQTLKLLEVSRYDFNWQESYIRKQPLQLPAGTRIECIAHFDNSDQNFANPDPTATVTFGEQTWDEMMIGYYEYYTN